MRWSSHGSSSYCLGQTCQECHQGHPNSRVEGVPQQYASWLSCELRLIFLPFGSPDVCGPVVHDRRLRACPAKVDIGFASEHATKKRFRARWRFEEKSSCSLINNCASTTNRLTENRLECFAQHRIHLAHAHFKAEIAKARHAKMRGRNAARNDAGKMGKFWCDIKRYAVK
jgi:hypothetical protein